MVSRSRKHHVTRLETVDTSGATKGRANPLLLSSKEARQDLVAVGPTRCSSPTVSVTSYLAFEARIVACVGATTSGSFGESFVDSHACKEPDRDPACDSCLQTSLHRHDETKE